VLRHVLCGSNTKDCEADLKRRLLSQASKTLCEKEVLVADAGFALADVLIAKSFKPRTNARPGMENTRLYA